MIKIKSHQVKVGGMIFILVAIYPVLYWDFYKINPLLPKVHVTAVATPAALEIFGSNSVNNSHSMNGVSSKKSQSHKMEFIEQRFSERLHLLQRECKRRPMKYKNRSNQDIVASSKLLRKYKLFQCEVHKAGSTTVNYIYALLYGMEELIKSKQIYKMLRYLKPIFTDFEEAMKSQDYKKFLIVRDPFKRLLSAFRNRIDGTGYNYQRFTWAPRILQYTRGLRKSDIMYSNRTFKVLPTFEEFCRYLPTVNPTQFDAHWRPVSHQCGVCQLPYTHVAHAETLSEDIQYIMRDRGIDQDVDISMIFSGLNRSKGNETELITKYYSTLSTETLQKIVDIYMDDFRLFGYDPTATLAQIFPNVTVNF